MYFFFHYGHTKQSFGHLPYHLLLYHHNVALGSGPFSSKCAVTGSSKPATRIPATKTNKVLGIFLPYPQCDQQHHQYCQSQWPHHHHHKTTLGTLRMDLYAPMDRRFHWSDIYQHLRSVSRTSSGQFPGQLESFLNLLSFLKVSWKMKYCFLISKFALTPHLLTPPATPPNQLAPPDAKFVSLCQYHSSAVRQCTVVWIGMEVLAIDMWTQLWRYLSIVPSIISSVSPADPAV